MAPQRALRIASGPRDLVVNVFPPNLLFGLAVTGIESAEKAPGVTLGKLGMLRDKRTRKLKALGPVEAVRGLQQYVRATFVATYTDG